MNGHGRLGNFHFNEGLWRGTSRYADNLPRRLLPVYRWRFQPCWDIQIAATFFRSGVAVDKLIDLSVNFITLVSFCTFQRSQVNTIEKKFLYFLYCFLPGAFRWVGLFFRDFIVLQIRLIFAQRIFVLVVLVLLFVRMFASARMFVIKSIILL